MLASQQRYDEALGAFEHCRTVDPTADAAWTYCGKMLYELVRVEAAVAADDRAVALNPDYERA